MCTSVKYNEEKSIPTVTIEDCVVHTDSMDVGDIFVEPGIIISQKNGTVTGRRHHSRTHFVDRMALVFSFQSEFTLQNFIIDNRRLFALDHVGNAHVYHFNGTTPEIHDIHCHPSGWCIVPNTRMMVTWNILTLRVYNPDTGQELFLKKHQARVTTAVAGQSVVVTGDSQGVVCIWYVSSWKCFHKLNTGTEAIEQIVVSETTVAIRTKHYVYQYVIETGKRIFEVDITASSIVYNNRGLVVARQDFVEFYVDGESKLAFDTTVARLVPSVHSGCWCIQDRELSYIKLSTMIEKWPTECLKWVRNPQFPFEHTWPTMRYMDVLALSVEEWLPKVVGWVPPRQWFRHDALRTAIWQWSARNNIVLAGRWLFLPHHKLKPWYDMCIQEAESLTGSFEFSEHVMHILEHLYKRTAIHSTSILKWCWFHHGKLKMRPIVMRLVEHSFSFMDIIAKEPASPTAILCFHITTMKLLMEKEYVATFLRLLSAFHYQPTDETRKMFQFMVRYVFTTIEDSNCDIPLPDTGAWVSKERFLPTDVGKYIKTEHSTGFVTSVKHNQEGQTVMWTPITTSMTSKELTEDAQIWSVYFESEPHTLMECALTLVNVDKWSGIEKVVPFQWFESEMGAFISEDNAICIFKKRMRVKRATWDETGASIETSTNTVIHESEGLPIEIESIKWSYIEDSTYDLTPLKIKLCSIASQKHVQLDTYYSTALLHGCIHSSIVEEHNWEMNVPVTTFVSDMKTFVVGLQNGTIYEFEQMSTFSYPLRSFMSHETQILSLHIFEDRLLSLSGETLCIWCLTTGALLFTKSTELQFVTAIPYVAMQFWVVEYGDYCIATIWDLEDEIPVKKIILPEGKHFLSAYHIQDMSVLVSTTQAILWSEDQVEHVYDIHISGVITCIAPTTDGIVGGTSTGNIFMLQFDTKEIREWTSTDSVVVTAMTPLKHTKLVVAGDANGKLSIWNTTSSEFELTVPISTKPIEHIYVDSIFAFVIHARHIKLVSIIQDRAGLSCQCIHNIMTWSYPWKKKVWLNTTSVVKPVVKECLRQRKHIAVAMDIIEECTEDYANRKEWCDEDTGELLIDIPATKLILKRLITFKGPRIDCPICGDPETKDSVSFLKTCHHRFHTGCIGEHISKTPEYHQEMQYQYALSVELKCPICRTSFDAKDVQIDHILN